MGLVWNELWSLLAGSSDVAQRVCAVFDVLMSGCGLVQVAQGTAAY